MGRLLDRFGAFEERSVIYRADDPRQKVHWRRLAVSYVLGSIVAVALLVIGGRVIGDVAAALVVVGAAIAFMVVAIVLRRRRNTRLTGSPTTWPSS